MPMSDEINELAEKLITRNEVAKAAAANRLVEIGVPAVPALLKLLRSSSGYATSEVIGIFRRMGEPAVPELLKYVKGDHPMEARNIIRKMGPKAIPELFKGAEKGIIDEKTMKYLVFWSVMELEHLPMEAAEIDLKKVRPILREIGRELYWTDDKMTAAYMRLVRCVQKGKERIDMPGELLPARIPKKPPMFRRRVAYA